MNRSLSARMSLCALLGWLGACAPSPESLSLLEPEERLLRASGESVKLEVHAHDRRGRRLAEPRVKWMSSAPDVVRVEEDGVVTAVKSGRAVVAVMGGRARAQVSFVVSIPGTLEVRAPGADFLDEGRSARLSAVVKNELGKPLADAQVEWHTSDPSVARVEDERVVGLRPGSATVTARVGRLSRSVQVRVVPADFARLALSHTRHIFDKRGQALQLQAQALSLKGTTLQGVPVEWFSSDARVVDVSPTGRVTAVGPGRAVVSATAGRKRTAAEFVVR